MYPSTYFCSIPGIFFFFLTFDVNRMTTSKMTTDVYNHVFALHSFTIWVVFFLWHNCQRWCEDRLNMRPETLTQLTSSVTRIFFCFHSSYGQRIPGCWICCYLYVIYGVEEGVSKPWLWPWKLFIKPLLLVLADSFKQQWQNLLMFSIKTHLGIHVILYY